MEEITISKEGDFTVKRHLFSRVNHLVFNNSCLQAGAMYVKTASL